MIHAVFFDIGGTVHTQDATPESDRDYIRRLWCFLHMNHIYTAETPEQLLEHINAGAKAYKSYTEQELIELPPDMIWQKFFLKDFDIPAEKLAGLGEELRPQPVDIDTGDPDFPTDSGSPVTPFSPQITVNVYGEVSEETVDNMRDSLRDTVRELYDEFREEELQQMSLKNQYSF